MALAYLLLSVLSSTAIGVIFKLFDRFDVPILQTIVVNYFVCVLVGWIVIGDFPIQSDVLETGWFPYALSLGILFIIGFTIAAKTFVLFGINMGTVVQKMSILVSVPFALIFFQEPLNALKITGIVLSILAIIFIHDIPVPIRNRVRNLSPVYLVFPLLTLLIGGMVEAMLQYVEMNVVDLSGDPGFISSSFFTAGCLGLLVTSVRFATGKYPMRWRGLTWGVILGIPNFFSVFFIMKSLGAGLDGSIFYPVNNVIIIVISVLIAFSLFKEKLSLFNWIGIFLAISSIAIIGLSSTQ